MKSANTYVYLFYHVFLVFLTDFCLVHIYRLDNIVVVLRRLMLRLKVEIQVPQLML